MTNDIAALNMMHIQKTHLFFQLIASLLLCFSLSACSGQVRGSRQTNNTALTAGMHTFSIEHEGKTRQYMAYIPQSYRRTQATPLVLSLHGGTGNMSIQANDKIYRLISKSEEAGFIAVFPNGYSRLRSGKFATWNAGKCCGKAQSKQVDDVGFLRKVIADVKTRANIDGNRIYSNGMSNGGMMSYRLACELSDTISAIGAVAGTDNTTHCTPKKPVSIIHIHAIDDDHVQFNGGSGVKALAGVDFVSVPTTINKWVSKNACNPKPKRVLTTKGAYCDLYTGCKDNTQVKLCVTDSGGHSWPGSQKRGFKKTKASQAMSATDMIWDFYQADAKRAP